MSGTDVANAVLNHQNDEEILNLWPTEEVLKREGLLFDKDGSHSQKWADVIETLHSLKKNPTANFSSTDTSRTCRNLTKYLMGCDPYFQKLLHLTDLFQKLSLQIKSADEIISAKEEEANVGPGYPPDFHSFAASNNRKEMCEFKRQLLSAVSETKEVLFQSIAAGVPDIIVNSETPERAKEVLSNIVSLRKQVSEAEDDLFRSLEQHMPILPNGLLLLHMAFLLRLHTTGLRLIKTYYHTPELLSLPMLNDLDPWRIRLELDNGNDNDEDEWEVISPTHSSARSFLPPSSSLSPPIALSLMQSRRPALHMRARSRVAAGRALHRPDAAAPRHRARGTGLYPLPPAPRGQPHRPRRRGLFSARDRPGPLPRPCRQRRTRRGGGRGEEVAVRRAQKRRVGVRPSRTHGSAARVQKRAK